MCQCAVKDCKRRVKLLENCETPPSLCYRHFWWYVESSQKDYRHLCTTQFPVFSAGDIAIWLAWIGA